MRVDLLEEYKTEADIIIDKQQESIYLLKEDLKKEKAKKHWIWPVIAVAAGIAIGGIVF